METKIIIIGGGGVFSANIYVDGKWFKQVGAGGDIADVLVTVAESLKADEDFEINPQNGKNL